MTVNRFYLAPLTELDKYVKELKTEREKTGKISNDVPENLEPLKEALNALILEINEDDY